MVFFVISLCLLLTSSLSIVGAEKTDQNNSRTKPINYKVVPKDDKSFRALFSESLLQNKLPDELELKIIKELEQNDGLRITTVNKAFCAALIVHLYSDQHYTAFSKCPWDREEIQQRIQLHGYVSGVNESLFINCNEFHMGRMCKFLKGQREVKLHCPSHLKIIDANFKRGAFGAIPPDPSRIGEIGPKYQVFKYQLANCQNSVSWDSKKVRVLELTESEYYAAKEKSVTTFLYVLRTLKDNKNLGSFKCSGELGNTSSGGVIAAPSSSITITRSIATSMSECLSTIQELVLQGPHIEEDAEEVFVDFIHNHEALEKLDLVDCVLTEEATKNFLKRLQYNRKLKTLELRYLNIKGEDLVVGLDGNTTLTSLNIEGDEWLDSNSVTLVSNVLRKNTALTDLYLNGSTISDGVSVAQIILDCTNIKKLSLYAMHSSSSCREEILDALGKNTTLTALDLGSTHINESGAQKLRHFIDSNSALKTLDLGGMLCEEGANQDEITKILTSNTTKKVNLSFCEKDEE